jgi:hypothetical protein
MPIILIHAAYIEQQATPALGRQDELNFLTGSVPNLHDDADKNTKAFKITGWLKNRPKSLNVY